MVEEAGSSEVELLSRDRCDMFGDRVFIVRGIEEKRAEDDQVRRLKPLLTGTPA